MHIKLKNILQLPDRQFFWSNFQLLDNLGIQFFDGFVNLIGYDSDLVLVTLTDVAILTCSM